jgi:hypothetical protein
MEINSDTLPRKIRLFCGCFYCACLNAGQTSSLSPKLVVLRVKKHNQLQACQKAQLTHSYLQRMIEWTLDLINRPLIPKYLSFSALFVGNATFLKSKFRCERVKVFPEIFYCCKICIQRFSIIRF